MRILHILSAIWKKSVNEFLIYRGTSLITFLLALIFFLIQIFTGHIYFASTHSINGWTQNQYLIMLSCISLATYLYNIFFIVGHEELASNILNGNLDYYLMRPISSYWSATCSQIDIPSIFNLIVSSIFFSFYIIKERVTGLKILLLILIIVLNSFFIFVLNQIFISLNFWINGLTAINGIVEDSISIASRPMQIFPRIIQNIFTFVIPILLVTNVPIMILKGQKSVIIIYYLVFVLLAYFGSKLMWKKGLTRYSSAN